MTVYDERDQAAIDAFGQVERGLEEGGFAVQGIPIRTPRSTSTRTPTTRSTSS